MGVFYEHPLMCLMDGYCQTNECSCFIFKSVVKKEAKISVFLLKSLDLKFVISAPFVSPLERNRSSDTIGQISLQSGGSQSNSRTNTLERQTPKNFPESLHKNSTIQEVIQIYVFFAKLCILFEP